MFTTPTPPPPSSTTQHLLNDLAALNASIETDVKHSKRTKYLMGRVRDQAKIKLPGMLSPRDDASDSSGVGE